LISEGSSKLASVPSGGGGGGGGAAAASGGAAAGGAAAAETKEEEKEEGTLQCLREVILRILILAYREGRVRRGYGFRSFRLSNQLTPLRIRCSHSTNTSGWVFEKLLRRLRISFACHGSQESDFADLLLCNLDSRIQTLPLPNLCAQTVVLYS
jgi:hypothetical protein